MKDFLITGAAGFIGSKLLSYLISKGESVNGFDNFKFSHKKNYLKNSKYLIKCDILNKKDLAKILPKFKHIIHLAAVDNRKLFVDKFDKSNQINIEGTKNILDIINNNQKLTYFSSNMVYGEGYKLPFTEIHPVNAYEPYALSKLCSENLIKSYFFKKKFDYLIIRNFNTFGPGQNEKSLIPTMILQAHKEKKIDVWSPNTTRDFQYIDDCIRNTYKLLKIKSRNFTVNLGTGKANKMKDVATKISKIFQCKVNLLNKSIPISHKNYADIKLLNKVLKNKVTQTNLDKALELTSNYYLQNYK